jgi:hypothetical protein
MRQWAAVRVAWGAECTNVGPSRMQKALHEQDRPGRGKPAGPV